MSQQVISFHYTLKNKDGTQIDSSKDAEPMTYMEGSGQIIPGLEEALKGCKVGDKKHVHVHAEHGYGQLDKELVFNVPRSQFPASEKIEVGMKFRAGQPNEPSPVFTVTAVTDEQVSVDGNHPLAGQDLFFDVEITEVRAATEEEVSHGHAHGPDGHHHH